jgi:hypothetical protein
VPQAIGEALILRAELRQPLTQQFVLAAQCHLRPVLGHHDYRRSAKQEAGNGKLNLGRAHVFLFEIGLCQSTPQIRQSPHENGTELLLRASTNWLPGLLSEHRRNAF